MAIAALRLAEDGQLNLDSPLAGRPYTLRQLLLHRADFAQVFWPKLRTYDPKWVYHGCLIGTALDAARLLHALFDGSLLTAKSVNAIFERSTLLEGVAADRPWTNRSYALGLMTGTMQDAGRAWGHSGGGPHSANAVYHFPDLDRPVTVATFTNGQAEGPAEFESVSIALRMQESGSP